MFRFLLYIPLISCILLLVKPYESDAASLKNLIKEGNMAYLSGEFDKALAAYEEASVNAPESPYIYFNKGAALYGQGDYSSAIEAFEAAALKSKDLHLEAKSRFNLGNCLFREAERQMDSDLNKSLEACQESIVHYQESLELDPALSEAAENIEVVRLVMKNILDEINKQKEAAEQQQEALEDAAQKLQELITKQKEALDRNADLENENAKDGDSQGLRQRTQELAGDQKDIKDQTEDLADEISEIMGQGDASSSENQVKKHLDNAVKEQEAASGNLELYNRAIAMDNQENALDDLNAALESMSQQGQQGQQTEKDEQQQANQEEQQQASSSEEEPGQNNEEQEEDQASLEQFSDDANDILEEEKENRRQRELQAAGSYKEVERDW